MIDNKKTNEKIPDEILSHQKTWLKKCNGYLGLLGSYSPSILIHTFSIASACSIISLILVTTTNIIGYNEVNLKHPVNESNCSCNCWDGFYRGKYARKSKGTEYKYFYFNYKQETLIIFMIALFYTDLLVNLIKKSLNHMVSQLVSGKKSLRWPVLIVLSVNVYSNFWYGWNLINFINDQDKRFFHEISVLISVELLMNFFYYKSLDRLCRRNGSYKPITMSTIAPIFTLNMFNFFMRLSHRLNEKFFLKLYSLDQINVDESLFFLKEVFGLLFVYFSLAKIKRTMKKDTLNKERVKGGYFYFSLWVLISGIFYGIRYSIINRK
ncbi:hypothetical protein BpHYR1_047533 [Brachionus plicatilis]|uniref:Uncharacterized protein n=1 Tax=Brachionus plicatilis TaxID=10195 RepID=A0A3M7QVE6_BRAPC|nr:hypothetical protein BpHYR1_047533 [Brachionus plicatilis]